MDILEKIDNILNEYGDGHIHKYGNGQLTGPPIVTKEGSHFHRLVNLEETGIEQFSEEQMGHYHKTSQGFTGSNITY